MSYEVTTQKQHNLQVEQGLKEDAATNSLRSSVLLSPSCLLEGRRAQTEVPLLRKPGGGVTEGGSIRG